LSRIKDASPDVVWIQAQNPSTAALVHNGAQQIMPDIDRIDAGPTGGSAETWALMDPGALEGVVFLSTIDPSNPRLQTLAERLGSTPEAAANYAVLSYDGVKILAQAIEDAGTTEGDAVKTALESISGYKASFGAPDLTISYSPTKHVGADQLCGFVLRVFDAENQPGAVWANAEPDCDSPAGNPRKG
ncbi:MAG: ABC transporter substrate-binding protein, partial [Acidimicrobiia bacterium]